MTPVGRRLEDSSFETIRAELAECLDAISWTPPRDRLLILPDGHYPYHPSTGLVTDPVVVEALSRELMGDVADLSLGVPGSPWLDAERTARYLGYARLADRLGIDLVHLEPPVGRESSSRIDDGRGKFRVPIAIEEAEIVVVPTLRMDPQLGVAAAAATIATALVGEAPTPDDVADAERLVDPALTVLDGTTVYTGRPYRARFLLCGEDHGSIDDAAKELLDRPPAGVLSRRNRSERSSAAVEVEGLSITDLAKELPIESPPENLDPGWMMQLGYRTYAGLTGDVVPPQFLGDG